MGKKRAARKMCAQQHTWYTHFHSMAKPHSITKTTIPSTPSSSSSSSSTFSSFSLLNFVCFGVYPSINFTTKSEIHNEILSYRNCIMMLAPFSHFSSFSRCCSFLWFCSSTVVSTVYTDCFGDIFDVVIKHLNASTLTWNYLFKSTRKNCRIAKSNL